ncbi:protein translocase subunit SecDF [Luteibaculum oceani]|uniref:Multifunctional fusion protein n=1 Tax=Luteibaculum oceani TaxID=1294296 RepID=A0A5C6VDD1_9FLAO|nr:protein translocase subunit SecDF [Luteibaculum oceani]TXC81645.1 protein translocase subunit SecDF [Luteibaculum oceani]
MQNKGAVWLLTILLGLACLYQISFSWVTSSYEKKAQKFAQSKVDSVRAGGQELSIGQADSIKNYYADKFLKDNGNKEIYPVFGYTYSEAKEMELNLGLDLQGGMAVTLEVSIPELVVALSGNSDNEQFKQAIELARDRQTDSQDDFITLFESAYSEVAPEGKLAAIFHSRDNKDKFPRDASNDEIIETLRLEAQTAIDNTERILRTRIDKFGVTQPTIQKQQYSGRILVELPGVKDKDRVRKVLQSTANLEFWETYQNAEVNPLLNRANEAISRAEYPGLIEELNERLSKADSLLTAQNTEDAAAVSAAADEDLEALLAGSDSAEADAVAGNNPQDQISDEEARKANPIFSFLQPAVFRGQNGQLQLMDGSTVGFAKSTDTAAVNKALKHAEAKKIFPRDLKFMWGSKADANNFVTLSAIKVTTRDGKAPLDGSVIVDARQDFDFKGDVEVSMQMNGEGASKWADMTKKNIGKPIAIVLDNTVQSAPVVQGEIPNGQSSISMGSGATRAEQIAEAEDLANILKAGALPAPASIVDESVVGPSLGQKNIDAGFMSFIIAFVIILFYMVFYYRGAGVVSDIALIANLFLLIGALASLGASLTLPGIAGIVLTIGMSVDANVLIYERVREELAGGAGLKAALSNGYKKAYAAIIDANLTTLLTAIVLAVFGSGPIKGFATTLIIGIFTSLYSAIFITRLIFTARAEAKKPMSFSSKITQNWFANADYKFVANRKKFYIISGVLILAGCISFATRGLNFGVDFTGGRTYTVKFDDVVELDPIRKELSAEFGDATAEVKTLGARNQVKITTNYLINEDDAAADKLAEEKLNAGLARISDSYSIEESRKVDPTISDDIEQSAILAIVFSLIIIFAYIVFRFRKWQFGLGALLAMFHDVILVLSFYSLLWGILPFSLEIDQAFIAAILTVVGYSINDTVVVFDRIREYLRERKSQDKLTIINKALNSTLSRTINTSLTTFIVLLMIFIFGGESIRGFVFALMVGVFFGTYSSLCIASPSVVDLSKADWEDKK